METSRNLDLALERARDFRREHVRDTDQCISDILTLVGTPTGGGEWTVPRPVRDAMGLAEGVIRRVPRDPATGSPWDVR